jgi:hypothetical protein
MKSKAKKCCSLPLKYPEVQDFHVTECAWAIFCARMHSKKWLAQGRKAYPLLSQRGTALVSRKEFYIPVGLRAGICGDPMVRNSGIAKGRKIQEASKMDRR